METRPSIAAAAPSSPNNANNKAPLPILSPTPSEPKIVQASFAPASPSIEFFEEEQEEEEESTCCKSSFWEMLCSLYLPILLLWLRRSMFGTANLLRSLLLGHLLRMLFGLIKNTDNDHHHWWHSLQEHPWLQPLLNQKDPHAWPPPAFTMLAALTIVAFVVHPDGLTWIMLGKLRDGLVTLFYSLGNGLGTMKDTYGILPTLFALATLAALGCLGAVLYKTLAPRKRPAPAPPKKKKHKKHKGRQRIRHHAPQRHGKKQPVKQQQVDKEPAAATTPPRPPISEKSNRSRFMSASTLDTCPLDDQSCGSTSVRSIASAPTTATSSRAPTTPTVLEQGHQLKSNQKKRKQHGKKKRMDVRKNVFEPTSPTLSSSSAPTRTTTRRLDGRRTRKPDATAAPVPPSDSQFSFFSAPSQSFFSHDVPQQTVRYSVPNYGAGDGRYTPEKMELAAFLARVGLVGTACADLLNDLPHVEALENLSKEDLDSRYKISEIKQREIQLLLEARRQERALCPPPGYGAVGRGVQNTVGAVDTSNVSIGAANQSTLGLYPTTNTGKYTTSISHSTLVPGMDVTSSTGTNTAVVGFDSDTSTGIPSRNSTMMPGLDTDSTLVNGINTTGGACLNMRSSIMIPGLDTDCTLNSMNATGNTGMANSTLGPGLDIGTGIPSTSTVVGATTDTSFLPAPTNTFSTLQSPSYGQPQTLSFLNSYGMVEEPVDEEDSSQIEQELQELGGQMVTSVLDF